MNFRRCHQSLAYSLAAALQSLGALHDRFSLDRRPIVAALLGCAALVATVKPAQAQSNVYAVGISGLGPNAQFETGNKLYEEKKFADAAACYQGILAAGQASAEVYFNLGNARFKANQLGWAIAAYREAERLTPRDPDLRANLQFARNQVEGPTLKPTRWQKLFGTLSLNEWTGLAATGLWLTFGLLALMQLRPGLKATLKTPVLLAGLTTVLLGAGLGVAAQVNPTAGMVIVTARDVAVRNGPLQESQTAFSVHDGAELRIVDRKDDWLQVTDGTRRVGWLKRSDVAGALPGKSS